MSTYKPLQTVNDGADGRPSSPGNKVDQSLFRVQWERLKDWTENLLWRLKRNIEQLKQRMNATEQRTIAVEQKLDNSMEQTVHQISELQRMIAEIENAFRLEKEKSESIMNDMGASRGQAKMIEQRLSQLQRVVASQTDGATAAKDQMAAIATEITGIKTAMQNQGRQEEQTNLGVAEGIAADLPENLSQMFAALECQLGQYEMSIAGMDVRQQIHDTTSYDGKMVWRIQDYHRRKHDAQMGRILSTYSQPFYTSKYGYKMCGRVYLNGDGMGRGTHISLYFVLMKGDYDSLLPWPFRQKISMTLLDQGPGRRHLSTYFRPDPTSSSFKRPTSDMNNASGCPLFVSHAVVDGSSYVRDDEIFIRIVVNVTGLNEV